MAAEGEAPLPSSRPVPPAEAMDLSPLLSAASRSLRPGDLLSSARFSLQDAMLAIEIGDPRLDAGCRWRRGGAAEGEATSVEALVRAGELQREIDLEVEGVSGSEKEEAEGEAEEVASAAGGGAGGALPLPLCLFLDWSLAAVLTWLDGGSLPQTVGASVHYLKGRELYCDAEEEAIAAGEEEDDEETEERQEGKRRQERPVGVGISGMGAEQTGRDGSGESSASSAGAQAASAPPFYGEAAAEVFLPPLEVSRLKRRALACSVAAIRGLVTVCHDVISSGLVADEEDVNPGTYSLDFLDPPGPSSRLASVGAARAAERAVARLMRAEALSRRSARALLARLAFLRRFLEGSLQLATLNAAGMRKAQVTFDKAAKALAEVVEEEEEEEGGKDKGASEATPQSTTSPPSTTAARGATAPPASCATTSATAPPSSSSSASSFSSSSAATATATSSASGSAAAPPTSVLPPRRASFFPSLCLPHMGAIPARPVAWTPPACALARWAATARALADDVCAPLLAAAGWRDLLARLDVFSAQRHGVLVRSAMHAAIGQPCKQARDREEGNAQRSAGSSDPDSTVATTTFTSTSAATPAPGNSPRCGPTLDANGERAPPAPVAPRVVLPPWCPGPDMLRRELGLPREDAAPSAPFPAPPPELAAFVREGALAMQGAAHARCLNRARAHRRHLVNLEDWSNMAGHAWVVGETGRLGEALWRQLLAEAGPGGPASSGSGARGGKGRKKKGAKKPAAARAHAKGVHDAAEDGDAAAAPAPAPPSLPPRACAALRSLATRLGAWVEAQAATAAAAHVCLGFSLELYSPEELPAACWHGWYLGSVQEAALEAVEQSKAEDWGAADPARADAGRSGRRRAGSPGAAVPAPLAARRWLGAFAPPPEPAADAPRASPAREAALARLLKARSSAYAGFHALLRALEGVGAAPAPARARSLNSAADRYGARFSPLAVVSAPEPVEHARYLSLASPVGLAAVPAARASLDRAVAICDELAASAEGGGGAGGGMRGGAGDGSRPPLALHAREVACVIALSRAAHAASLSAKLAAGIAARDPAFVQWELTWSVDPEAWRDTELQGAVPSLAIRRRGVKAKA